MLDWIIAIVAFYVGWLYGRDHSERKWQRRMVEHQQSGVPLGIRYF